MNKNSTSTVILLLIIAALLVLGGVYFYMNQQNQQKEAAEPIVTENGVTEDLFAETRLADAKPLYEAGNTVLINENVKPWVCSANGDPCDKILVTTEVELTEPSMGDQLTGRFYIRAYNGGDYRNSPKIGEKQITQNFDAFAEKAEDTEGSPEEMDTEEILTIKAEEESFAADEINFKPKFYFEYLDPVPGWDNPGYILHLENEGKLSDYNNRYTDFYFSDGKMDISFPQ